MFKVESNIEQVKKEVKLTINQLIDVDKILREASLDAVVMISDRVQQRGENTAGEKMITKSTPKKGAYSSSYADKRVKNGLQIEHIDLTFQGDMMNDFTVAPDGETGYIIGFRGQLSSDKSEWNERKFGTIFQLSETESELIKSIITNKINAILNK